MTDAKYHTPEPASLEGRIFRPATPQDVADAVELVFDYRGDATIEVASGERVVGYVFNREGRDPRPYVEMLPEKADGGPRRLYYDEIRAIAVTGKDTASGKSWEAWIAKKESQRKAEADRAADEARARGYL